VGAAGFEPAISRVVLPSAHSGFFAAIAAMPVR
jgi:hypothetical protein